MAYLYSQRMEEEKEAYELIRPVVSFPLVSQVYKILKHSSICYHVKILEEKQQK